MRRLIDKFPSPGYTNYRRKALKGWRRRRDSHAPERQQHRHRARRALDSGRPLVRGARAARRSSSTGPNGAGKSSLLRAIAGFLPLAAGAFALEGGASEASIGRAGALSRPCRRAERRPDGGRESRILGWRARAPIRRAALFRRAWLGAARSSASASPMSRIFPCARCRRGRSAASRWRGFSSRPARYGCSTSRRRRSTPRRRACSPGSCASTSAAAA